MTDTIQNKSKADKIPTKAYNSTTKLFDMVSEINRKKRLVKKNNNEWVNFIWTNIKEHETSKWLEKKHKSNVKWRQSHRNSMKLNVRGEGGRTREFEEIEVEALRWLVLLWMLMCSSFSVSFFCYYYIFYFLFLKKLSRQN